MRWDEMRWDEALGASNSWHWACGCMCAIPFETKGGCVDATPGHERLGSWLWANCIAIQAIEQML